MLGIIGAMDEEVSKIKELMNDVTVTTKASMDFYKGTIFGKDVVVVRSVSARLMRAFARRFLLMNTK